MIIALRATRPDYRELLLMTHRLPRIAPCCSLSFAYLCIQCRSSGMDLCLVSPIWESVLKVVMKEPWKQSLACLNTFEHETLNNHQFQSPTGGVSGKKTHFIVKNIRWCSICCKISNFTSVIIKQTQLLNKDGVQDIHMLATQYSQLCAFGLWGRSTIIKMFSLCRMFQLINYWKKPRG